MDNDRSHSAWQTITIDRRPPLTENAQADVCIVGAGMAGITTAYLLAREGRSVIVLDDGAIGGGETGQTTAHLANALDDRYQEIERIHGVDASRLAAESHTAAIACIESNVQRERIACDFTRLDGYLFLAPDTDPEELDLERAAAHRAGLTAVERLSSAPIANLGPCLRFPDQGQFHPLKYLRGLVESIERMGGRICCDTHVDSITGGADATVTTGRGPKVACGAIVVATNVPVNDLFAIHTKQAPYLTYVIGVRVPRGSVPRGLYWDTQDPYHYIRLHALHDGTDLLIVGGEDHKTGQAQDQAERFSRLLKWTREQFPQAGDVEYRWSGQVMETDDGLAFIGRNPMDHDNVYVCTGDSGMGMTHGTIAGLLITDAVVGRENPWRELYDPSRIRLRATGEFLKENLNVAAQYVEYVTPGEVDSADAIQPGHGAILRRGPQKIAAYRDDAGTLHERSAVCTHLGCLVAWNEADRTWDCPCHGSRYDRHGEVITGPANKPLAPVD